MDRDEGKGREGLVGGAVRCNVGWVYKVTADTMVGNLNGAQVASYGKGKQLSEGTLSPKRQDLIHLQNDI